MLPLCRFEETLNTLKYANRAKQMSPPSVPHRNVRENNPVDEKVEVLKDLKESLLPMMKQIITPQQQANGAGKKAGKTDRHADKENGNANARDPKGARDERAERRARERDGLADKRGLAARGASEDEDVDEIVIDAAPPNPRRLSAAAEEAASAAAAAAAGNDTANMAEVRKALEEVCQAEPEARSNPAVQAAYVALDNMEAEEVEAISAESALLFKEQQNLIREVCHTRLGSHRKCPAWHLIHSLYTRLRRLHARSTHSSSPPYGSRGTMPHPITFRKTKKSPAKSVWGVVRRISRRCRVERQMKRLTCSDCAWSLPRTRVCAHSKMGHSRLPLRRASHFDRSTRVPLASCCCWAAGRDPRAYRLIAAFVAVEARNAPPTGCS